jgi:uncharacterized membrane protein
MALDRIVFFSDAVFAIVITLLVLPLATEADLGGDAGGLASRVLDLWPKVLAFMVSFLVIGQFWIAHHRMYGLLRRHDLVLMWLNLISLMTITFIPFPTALLDADAPGDHFPVVFYAASLTLASLSLFVSWLYALRFGNLVDERLDRRATDQVTVRSLATLAVFLVSVGAAFFGLGAALACWLVLLPVTRVLLARQASSVS